MKLSMWILADWLKKYNQINYIKEGRQILTGVRLFSDDTEIENQYIYLSRAKEFIPSGGDEILCVQGNDMILLETDNMETVLNEVFTAFDFYNNWENSIKNMIYTGYTLQEILDESHRIFNDPIVIYDAGNIAIAYSSQYPVGSLDSEWDNLILYKRGSIDKLYKIKEYLNRNKECHHIMHHNSPVYGTPCMWRNIFLKEKNMGRIIVLEKNNSITQGRMHLTETFCCLTETWIAINQDTSELGEETLFFKNLLKGKSVNKDAIISQLEMISWLPKDSKLLIKICNDDIFSRNELSELTMRSLKYFLKNCYLFEYENSILVIVNLRLISNESLEEQLLPILDQSKSYCSISFEFTDIMTISEEYEQCNLTIENSPQKNGEIYYCQDYALDYMHNILQVNVTPNILHPALSVLKKMDRDGRGELYNTLYQFLLNERNLVKTAVALNIHRNSLVYRINRIIELTGIDLNDCDVREYLLLSYKIDKNRMVSN